MKNTKKEPTFEQAMSRLEEIVLLLENGGAPLDETMELYTEGAKLSALCAARLDKAEQTIITVGGEHADKADKKEESKQ
jgi:exodeoxyribonuclease VII small subunit